MTVFILPTTGRQNYRGKYPFRARSIGATRVGGRHIELNNGTRLWGIADRTPEFCAGSMNDDYESVVARAVPMTAEQYGELQRAAQIERAATGRPVAERLEAGNEAFHVRVAIVATALAPAEIEKTERLPAPPVEGTGRQYIDMTPTWAAVLPIFIAALQNGTGEGQKAARLELTRMAELADKRNVLAARLNAMGAILGERDGNAGEDDRYFAELRAAFNGESN